MIDRRLLFIIASPFLPFAVGAAPGGASAQTIGSPVEGAEAVDVAPPADHHMHVWSEEARDALRRLIASTRDGEAPELPIFDAERAVAELDSAGIERGVLLSTAYVFGSPDVDFGDEYRKVRAENDWVARQAAGRPDRLVAFFGVNPLAPYALEETGRCASLPECTGMKIQLQNSGVDFHDPDDVRALRRFFRRADELDLPVVVHFRTRRADFGAREVNVFVERVLPAAPDVPIQIAHLGGAGRFDAATGRVVRAFVEAFQAHPDRMENVLFDMGLVPISPSRARGDSARRERYEEMNRLFVEAVRELGPDRVLFATDYPEARPAGYLQLVRQHLPLSDRETRDLLDDRASYLREAGADGR